MSADLALDPLPSRRKPRWPAIVLIALCAIGLAGIGYGRATLADIAAALPKTPDVATMPVSTVMVDRNGELLRPYTTNDGIWRLPVELKDVDRHFIDMLIAYEDRHFAAHHGIDWGGVLRAAGQFVLAGGHIVSGGSTLSMQLARLIEVNSTRDLGAKVRQMVHADALEHQLSKDQILSLYLNLAPYGGNIEGIRAASLAYFGKEPARLTTAEAALLVALPQSPEARRPDRDPKAAEAGRNLVLDRMVSEGVLSAEEAAAAKREPIPTARRDFPMLAAHLGDEAVKAKPNAREIKVTIDKRLQGALEKLAQARATMIGPKVSVAIVAADLATGDILASVGSAGYLGTQNSGFVDMTEAWQLRDSDPVTSFEHTGDGSLWITAPDSIEQVGCIHTCQGLELDYIGVIIGPDLTVRDGMLRVDPAGRSTMDRSIRGWKTLMKQDPGAAAQRTAADQRATAAAGAQSTRCRAVLEESTCRAGSR